MKLLFGKPSNGKNKHETFNRPIFERKMNVWKFLHQFVFTRDKGFQKAFFETWKREYWMDERSLKDVLQDIENDTEF